MKKRKTALVVALIVMGVALLGLAAGVYAKYIATFTKEGGAKVATWAFESDNTAQEITCSLTSTVVSGALATAASGGDIIIAPGTSGTCTIELKNTTSEVKVKYEISSPVLNGAPTNLKLNGAAADSFTPVTGYIDMGGTDTATITWEWPYETGTPTDGVAPGDEDDTDDGEAGGNMTVTFTVKGIQVNPATGTYGE